MVSHRSFERPFGTEGRRKLLCTTKCFSTEVLTINHGKWRQGKKKALVITSPEWWRAAHIPKRRFMILSPFYKSPVGQADAVLPQDVGHWQRDAHMPGNISQPLVKLLKLLGMWRRTQRLAHLRVHERTIKSSRNKWCLRGGFLSLESSVTFLLASYYKDISLTFKGKTYIIRQNTRNYAVQYNLQLCKKYNFAFPTGR